MKRIGIAVPQGNPTVEPELTRLFADRASMHVARSVSTAQPAQRLLDYFSQLEATMKQFDGMPMSAFGFACTGSSYLLDGNKESREIARLSNSFDMPVITATCAIKQTLMKSACQRLAIASPYPQWLHAKSIEYWTNQGYEVSHSLPLFSDMGDTRGIYSANALAAAERVTEAFTGIEADVILISGTGLASLEWLPQVQKASGIKTISSNQCLAQECMLAAGLTT